MKWGIIGTGRIANKFANTLVYLKKEGEKFVAVASRDIDKADIVNFLIRLENFKVDRVHIEDKFGE